MLILQKAFTVIFPYMRKMYFGRMHHSIALFPASSHLQPILMCFSVLFSYMHIKYFSHNALPSSFHFTLTTPTGSLSNSFLFMFISFLLFIPTSYYFTVGMKFQHKFWYGHSNHNKWTLVLNNVLGFVSY
jgi:hypothetical protein